MNMSASAITAPLPPLVPGLPVLGSMLSINKDLLAFIVKQYQSLGPIFRMRILNQEMVVLAGSQANIFVTREGADKFSSREVWQGFGQEFGVDDYVQAIDGPGHLAMRKVMKRGYSASALMADTSLLAHIAQRVIDGYQVGDEETALTLLRLIITEQLGTVLANHAPGADLNSIILMIRTALNVHINKTTPALKLKSSAYRNAKQRVLGVGEAILDEHRSTSRAKPDLVDDLLTASQQEQYQDVLGKEEQLVLSSLGPFVAGLDTVANECNFMLYELFQHPDVLAQCVANADQLFADRVPQLADLKKQGAIHHTMQETLRMHSIAPVVMRTAAKTFEFAGCRVEEGQAVMLATTCAHFLPENFAEPEKFDITRYGETRKEHKKAGAYYPFGIGTHLCLGAGAAEVQIVLVIASLLYMVRLERLDPGRQLPVKNDPTPTLGTRFRLRIAERRHQLA